MSEPDSPQASSDYPCQTMLHVFVPKGFRSRPTDRNRGKLRLSRIGAPQRDAGQVRLNGQLHLLLYWSAEGWEEVPEQERPTLGVIRGIKGGRFCLVPVEP